MSRLRSHRFFPWGSHIAAITVVALSAPSSAYALDSYTIQDNFYRLMTGGFGTLVMIFAGAGGIATVYMQRSGRAGDRVPIYGIVLMLVAVAIFTLRVMVTAGVVGFRGNEYQGYDVSERGY